MASLSYYFREATVSLRRGGGSNLLAMATIALAVFVFGAFLLVAASLGRMMATWSATAEMSVYLQDDASDQQRTAIESAIAASPLVDRRDFVSKAQAAQRFRRDFPDLATAADGLAVNPFPASYEIRLRAARAVPARVQDLARSIGSLAGVADVRYDQQWLDRLARIVAIVRWVGVALATALAVAAALTVGAVVRLGMVARSDEVEIMGLVGAPISAIRGPFVLEGVLQGGLGATVALVALRGAYEMLRVRVTANLPGVDPSLVQFLSPAAIVAIAGGGMIVGCIGGLIATRAVR